MQSTTSRKPRTVTTDGHGVVSYAGTVSLAELADRIGLTAVLSEASDGLRERWAGYDPGRMLVDVSVAIADGVRSISDVQTRPTSRGCSGRQGPVGSTATIWRVLNGIDAAMLAEIRLTGPWRGTGRGSRAGS